MIESYRALMAAEKVPSGPLVWSLREADDQRSPSVLEIVSTLEVDRVTLRGVRMRLTALKHFPDEDVCFQLEHLRPRAKFEPLCRIEWRPRAAHGNGGLGPREHRFRRIEGSHHHRFDLNWSPSEEMMLANLPIAVPILPDPADFGGLLDFIEREVRVRLVGRVPSPPWEEVTS